jgi:hypothetical protein
MLMPNIQAILVAVARYALYRMRGRAPERMNINTSRLRIGSTLWHGDHGWMTVVWVVPGAVWVVPAARTVEEEP